MRNAIPDEPQNESLNSFLAPNLADLTDDILFGQVWSDPTLSPRYGSLVTVSALVAMNRPDQLRSHLGLARRNGVTKDELIGVITHLLVYSGWPNAVTAIALPRNRVPRFSAEKPEGNVSPSSLLF